MAIELTMPDYPSYYKELIAFHIEMQDKSAYEYGFVRHINKLFQKNFKSYERARRFFEAENDRVNKKILLERQKGEPIEFL